MEITKLNHIHFTGIKGVGMTALALCAQDLGINVTGSDTEEVFITDETLKKRGIKWNTGFKPEHIKDKPDLVIATGAHGGFQNPEVVAAQKLGIPVMTLAEALAEFMKGKIGISICGVGGKTTVSSMLAHILDRAEENPSYAIGTSQVFSLDAPGKYDKNGRHFVAEADEYVTSPTDHSPRFSFQNPEIIVATNIKHDHPDVYPTLDDTKKTFLEFFNKVTHKGMLIANFDDEVTGDMLHFYTGNKQTYGVDAGADWIIMGVNLKEGVCEFSLMHAGSTIGPIKLTVPGLFNIYNATASIIAAASLGVESEKAAYALHDFTGTKRRFEKMGEKGKILFYDDYAHHPIEIKATLKAARAWFGDKRIVAVFQPHTYSRTRAFLEEFAGSFDEADIVGIMDIYASAREEDSLGVSGELLAAQTQLMHVNAHYAGDHTKTLTWLKKVMQPGDVVITLGAGDIFQLHTELI